MEDILKGAYDMHIHTSPDVSPRKSTDIEIAEEWKTAGMKGGVVKCHFADTTGRAAILSALYPDLKIYGGLVLNRQAGGINPDAVERMAQAGGKYVWFPTMDSLAYRKFHFRNDPSADLSPYLSVMGEDGKLLPAVYDVLDIAAKYDLVVGTGHIGGTGRGSCRAGGGEARREAPGADPCGESGDKFFHRRSETLRESRGDGGAQLLYSLPQPRELGACDRADPRGRNRQHVSCHRFRPAKFPGIRRWTPHVCGRSSGTWIFGERNREDDKEQSGEIVYIREKRKARSGSPRDVWLGF